jgi:hypothetical protein
LLKRFNLTERFQLEFRAEGYDTFNTTHFGLPYNYVTSPSVGALSSASDARDIQFGLKLSF